MILRRIVKLLACTLLVFTYSCTTSTSEIPNTETPTDPGTDPIEETETENALPSTISVEVNYDGQEVGNLFVTLFEAWPPSAPPSKFSEIQSVQFPAATSLTDVPAGTWFVAAVLDVAPYSAAQQGPEDLVSVVEVTVPTNGIVTLTLEDNEGTIPTDPEPEIENPGTEEIIPPSSSSIRYRRITVDSDAYGPAFGTVEDINADGKQDLIVSKFGQVTGFSLPPGRVTVYLQGDTIEDWDAFDIVKESDGIVWPNDISLEDVDGDGDLDAIVPYGFLVCTAIPGGSPCGGLAWFEQSGNNWIRHDIIPSGSTLFYHKALLTDLDGDGINDLITVGESKGSFMGGSDRAEAVWFKGTSSGDHFEKTPRTIGDGLGSLPVLYDIDNDGDLDIASGEFFINSGASFTWFEQVAAPSASNANGTWTRHIIDSENGPSIQLSIIEDFYGDGEPIAIGSNHTNTSMSDPDPWESAVISYRMPQDPTQPWDATVLTEGIVSVPGSSMSPQAAPGVFGWGDLDGDSDKDLMVSGDGDPRIFLLEQLENEEFVVHILDKNVGMTGGMVISDLNGDGSAELLANSYDLDHVYLYIADEDGSYPVGILSAPEGWGDSEEETVTPDPGTVDPEVNDKSDELFMSDGDPFAAGPLLTVSTSVSAGTEGAPTDMLIFTPSTEGTYAVIVFSHGFLLANQYYTDTLEHLASHGFIVVAPQTHQAGGLPIGKPSTSEEAATLRAVLSWIPDGLAGLVNVEPEVELIGIAGHSRGAKIGWLALQADPTLGYAIASVDPVNGTGDIFTMNEVSALDKGLPVGMPSLIIGSGLGEESAGLFQPACSPSGQNHVQFFESADSPSWHIIASDAGHLDFIDPSPAGCGFACTACVTGTNIENNLQLSMGALAAFFRGQLQGDIAALAFLVDKSSHPANSQVETK